MKLGPDGKVGKNGLDGIEGKPGQRGEKVRLMTIKLLWKYEFQGPAGENGMDAKVTNKTLTRCKINNNFSSAHAHQNWI